MCLHMCQGCRPLHEPFPKKGISSSEFDLHQTYLIKITLFDLNWVFSYFQSSISEWMNDDWFTFSRRFYPKRLTLHSSYSFYIWSALAFPGNRTHDLGVANAMLYQLSYRKAVLCVYLVFESNLNQTLCSRQIFSDCFYRQHRYANSDLCVSHGNIQLTE